VDKANVNWDKEFHNVEIYQFKDESKWKQSFLVLPLNFAGLDASTFESFQTQLNKKLNNSFDYFCTRNRSLLKQDVHIDNDSAITTFGRLVTAVQESNEKLFIIIDEYDTSINTALNNKEFTTLLGQSRESKIEKMESIFKLIFSEFKTACDNGIARVFLTGVTPLVF
jgi:hypothetical protein